MQSHALARPRARLWPFLVRAIGAILFRVLILFRGLVAGVLEFVAGLAFLGLVCGLIIAHGHPPVRFAVTSLVIAISCSAIAGAYDRVLLWLEPHRPS